MSLHYNVRLKDIEIKLNLHSNSPSKVNQTKKDYQMIKRKPRVRHDSLYFQGRPFTIEEDFTFIKEGTSILVR